MNSERIYDFEPAAPTQAGDPSILSLYLAEIATYEPLTPPQEETLGLSLSAARAMRQHLSLEISSDPTVTEQQIGALVESRIIGDPALTAIDKIAQDASKTLFEHNLHLVPNVAVAHDLTDRGVEDLDLIQEGNIALMKASERWDVSKGTFEAYAVKYISGYMHRLLQNTSRTIRIPVRVFSNFSKTLKMQRVLSGVFGRKPTVVEIADKSGLSVEQVENARAAFSRFHQRYVPFSTPFGPEEGDVQGEQESLTLGDVVADPETVDERGRFHRLYVDYAELEGPLSRLPERNRIILTAMFGFGGIEPQSLDQAAEIVASVTGTKKLSKERIRQLEREALQKIRRQLLEYANANHIGRDELGEDLGLGKPAYTG